MIRPARLAIVSILVAQVIGACSYLEKGKSSAESLRPGARGGTDPGEARADAAREQVAPASGVVVTATEAPPPPPPVSTPAASPLGSVASTIPPALYKPEAKAPEPVPARRPVVKLAEKLAGGADPAVSGDHDQMEGDPGASLGEPDKDGASGLTGEGGNTFARLEPNPFVSAERDRFSTFAIDVDTASYTLSRRYIGEGRLPPPAGVRVEEYVNYFRYRYAPPIAGAFSVSMEGAPSPFTRGHHVLRVGLQGKVVSRSERRPANLVFLMDTSGSMSSPDRLPLAREAVKMAVRNLNENDTVALVTYAGGVRDVLPPTPATEQAKIFAAVDSLQSGGGTAMGSGMELAYRHAVQRARAGVVSRVIVLTDGDTNIGPSLSADAMLEVIDKYVKEGVTLSTIGFGMGNYRDALMERLADKGNGNCFYVDGPREARRVFEERLAGTVEVIAKDVKIQVELNPRAVRTYRLLGYENRDIADRDFRDDKVDAGEIGAGHSVTALYEVQLAPGATAQDVLATVRIRAKEPFGTRAFEQAFPFGREKLRAAVGDASADFRFALAVAGTADILRHSTASEGWSLAQAQSLAEGAVDGLADRKEFVSLLQQVRNLWGRERPVAGR